MELIKNLTLAAANTDGTPPPADWIVVVMGMGVVFIGLILIIFICKIMGSFFTKSTPAEEKTDAPVVAAPTVQNTVIENRQEIIAAVTAVCAEEMGKDVSAVRVISFKKL